MSTYNINLSFYKDALDKLPSLVCFLDEKLIYRYINEAYKSYFNITEEDFVGKCIFDLMSYQFHAMLAPYIESALDGNEQIVEFILPISNENIVYRIVNIHITPHFNNKKALEGLLCIIHDITELKTSATIAIEKEKKLNALFNSLNQGVVLQDAKGKVVEFNHSALNILKLTKSQLLGKSSFDPYWRVVNEDFTDLPSEQHPAIISLKTGLPVVGKVMGVYTSEAELSWMNVTAIPLFSENENLPTGVLVTFEDLTRTKKLVQELKARIYWQEALLNGTEYIMISTYPNGKIATFNKKAEQTLGYKIHEVVNKYTPIIFHKKEEISSALKKLSLHYDGSQQLDFETFLKCTSSSEKEATNWTYIAKNLTAIPVKLSVTSINDESKTCIGYLYIAEVLS